MKATKADIDNLEKLQKVDAKIKTEISSIENLPEKKELLAINEKLSQLEAKIKQVEKMKIDVDKRFEKMNSEDASLAEREKSVQQSIDEVAGDYRNLEVHTKELDSISSRRNTLSEIMLKATVEVDKVSELDKKIKEARDQIIKKKEKLNETITAKRENARSKVDELRDTHNKLHSSLPSEIIELYDDAVGKVGNVVLAGLEGNCCSVCRTQIEEGKLIEIQKGGQVALCPSCGRIIIVQS